MTGPIDNSGKFNSALMGCLYFTSRTFALDSAVVKTQNLFSSRRGFITYATSTQNGYQKLGNLMVENSPVDLFNAIFRL